jgi:MFS superfamily sulfate permease-like transporter
MLTKISNIIKTWISQKTIRVFLIITLLMPIVSVQYGIYFGILTILMNNCYNCKKTPQLLNERVDIKMPYVD